MSSKVKGNKFFIINGKGGAGKDSFIKYVFAELDEQKIHIEKQNISSIDNFRTAAEKFFGYSPEDKSEKGRQLLVALKQAAMEYNDRPFCLMAANVSGIIKYEGEPTITFLHIREPHEIDKMKNFILNHPQGENTSVATVLVQTPETSAKSYGNIADDNVDEYTYDIIIDNNGTKGDLLDNAIAFIKTEITGE